MSVKTSELSKPEIIYRGLPHNLPVCGFAQRQMMYFHIIKMDSCIGIYVVLREHICHLVTCLGNCAQRMDVVLVAVSVTEQRVESGTEKKHGKKKENHRSNSVLLHTL